MSTSFDRSALAKFAIFLAASFMTLEGSAALRPAPAHHLRLTLTADAIDVERAAPGGTVLVIGYERIVRDFAPVYRRVQREGTADARGSVRVPHDLPQPDNDLSGESDERLRG